MSSSSIGEAEFLHVAEVLAYFSRGWFGLTSADSQERLAARLQAEKDLRMLNAGTTLHEPVEVDYF